MVNEIFNLNLLLTDTCTMNTFCVDFMSTRAIIFVQKWQSQDSSS